MKKYIWLFIILCILVAGGFIFYFLSNKKDNSGSGYNASKSGSNISINHNENANNVDDNSNVSKNVPSPVSFVEQEVASYSTVIKNKKDSNRQQNITLTCSSLNGTEIKPGNTFSFCDTVGKATPDRGYLEANIIVDGIEEKGLGGGNCQISSTLYNAVLAFPELEIVERHPHSADVPYIEKGKDAAVSYGTHDFKFKNNSDSSVKIYASNTPDDITIKIVKLIPQ